MNVEWTTIRKYKFYIEGKKVCIKNKIKYLLKIIKIIKKALTKIGYTLFAPKTNNNKNAVFSLGFYQNLVFYSKITKRMI